MDNTVIMVAGSVPYKELASEVASYLSLNCDELGLFATSFHRLVTGDGQRPGALEVLLDEEILLGQSVQRSSMFLQRRSEEADHLLGRCQVLLECL